MKKQIAAAAAALILLPLRIQAQEKDIPEVRIICEDICTNTDYAGRQIQISDETGNVTAEWKIQKEPFGDTPLRKGKTAVFAYDKAYTVRITDEEDFEPFTFEITEDEDSVHIDLQGRRYTQMKRQIMLDDSPAADMDWLMTAEEADMPVFALRTDQTGTADVFLPEGTYHLRMVTVPSGFYRSAPVIIDTSETDVIEVQQSPIFLQADVYDSSGALLKERTVSVYDMEGNRKAQWKTGSQPDLSGVLCGHRYRIETEPVSDETPADPLEIDIPYYSPAKPILCSLYAYGTDMTQEILPEPVLPEEPLAIEPLVTEETVEKEKTEEKKDREELTKRDEQPEIKPVLYIAPEVPTKTQTMPVPVQKAAVPFFTVRLVNEQGELLAGAHMEAYDAAGNLIDSWTSEAQPHKVQNDTVRNGEIYRIHQTAAPFGYERNRIDLEFVMPAETGENGITVTMQNRTGSVIEEITDTQPHERAHIPGWAVFGGSACAAGVLLWYFLAGRGRHSVVDNSCMNAMIDSIKKQ